MHVTRQNPLVIKPPQPRDPISCIINYILLLSSIRIQNSSICWHNPSVRMTFLASSSHDPSRGSLINNGPPAGGAPPVDKALLSLRFTKRKTFLIRSTWETGDRYTLIEMLKYSSVRFEGGEEIIRQEWHRWKKKGKEVSCWVRYSNCGLVGAEVLLTFQRMPCFRVGSLR